MSARTSMLVWDLKQQRAKVIEDYLAEEKQLRDAFDAKLAGLDGRIAAAEAQEHEEYVDPDVLVRMSLGARRKVYHSADHPCGRVTRGGNFKRMKETAAKVYDANVGITLARCAACWSES